MRFRYFLRNRQSLTDNRPIIQASEFRNAAALVPTEFRIGLLGGPNTKGSTQRFHDARSSRIGIGLTHVGWESPAYETHLSKMVHRFANR
jgi:hypothetical protein